MTGERRRLVVAGAGGHAKSVVEVLLENDDFEIVGCTSAQIEGSPVLGVPVLGTDDALAALFGTGVEFAVAAIGDNGKRRNAAETMRRIGFTLVAPVSSAATLGRECEVGAGSVIMPGGIVRAGVKIGQGVIINTAASVDHDCTIGEFAHLAPGVRLAGSVHVGRNAFVGIGVTVAPGVRIGDDAVIGAGSLVLRDIPARVVAYGSPARVVRNLEGAQHE